MRTISLAVVALLAVGLFGARPAEAAGWSCVGPEFVCGGTTSGATASTPKAKSASKARARTDSAAAYDAAPTRTKHRKTAARTRSKATRTAHVAPTLFSGGGSHYQSGVASYYHEPQRTASGGWFNPNALTAAHRSLPFGTKVRVTNQRNGQSVVVTINDRGPFVGGRVIDLSAAAAGAINMKGAGVAPVSLAVLGK